MKVSREITNIIHFVLDNVLPPFVRESRILMTPLFRLALGPDYKVYMRFKEEVAGKSDDQLGEYYSRYAHTFIKRESDLNAGSIRDIIENITGKNALDVGCGGGYLLRQVQKAYPEMPLKGTDFNIAPQKEGTLELLAGNILKLPFKNNSFDTVICTHTLEHVIDIYGAIEELRRVAKKRLIVVVPKQREYRYTFDFHVHFFPYIESFQRLMQNEKAVCYTIDRDIFYMEDY